VNKRFIIHRAIRSTPSLSQTSVSVYCNSVYCNGHRQMVEQEGAISNACITLMRALFPCAPHGSTPVLLLSPSLFFSIAVTNRTRGDSPFLYTLVARLLSSITLVIRPVLLQAAARLALSLRSEGTARLFLTKCQDESEMASVVLVLLLTRLAAQADLARSLQVRTCVVCLFLFPAR